MFLAIKGNRDSGETYNANINVAHIVDIEQLDARNPDSGSNIKMRDGSYHEVDTPMYELMIRIKKIQEQYAGIIIMSYISEFTKIIKSPTPRRSTRPSKKKD